jgi:hypothetical protein
MTDVHKQCEEKDAGILSFGPKKIALHDEMKDLSTVINNKVVLILYQ